MALPGDDEPTVIRTGGGTAPTVRTEPTMPQARTVAHAPGDDTLSLPIGTRLGEFELTRRLGEGGFGIVYQAWDHTLDRSVALKEYLPASIATRVGVTQISCRSERHRETFEAGLKSFINEAKLLARFDHPSLVKVFRFWEAHGTAYMVMPFYEGTTMRDTVRALPAPPDEAWLLDQLAALTEALSVIHAEQCYHRDIAPDNVMLLQGSGRPLLLDFGAARRVIGEVTQALTVILKPGYAPVEQYAEVPGMKQGPWTDVYALAAVVYWCITGKTPPPSVGRMLSDSCVPLAQAAAGRYSAGFLEAIDRALRVRPEERTQTIEALRAELGLGPAPVSPGRATTVRYDPDATVIRPSAAAAQAAAVVVPGSGRIATTQPAVRAPSASPSPRTEPPPLGATPAPEPAGASTSAAAPAGRRTPLMAAGAAALLLAGGGAWMALRPAVTPTPSPAASAPVAASPATAPAAPAQAPAPQPQVAAVAAPLPPASADELLARWRERADRTLAPTLGLPARAFVGNALRIDVSAVRAGDLRLVARRDGSDELLMIGGGTAVAGRPLVVDWPAALAVSPGRWRLAALWSAAPWDAGASGWSVRDGLARWSAGGPAADGCGGAAPCDPAVGLAESALELHARPAEPPPRPAPERPVARPPEPKPVAQGNAAECARLLAQMSLGDAPAAVTARYASLGCR